MKINLIRPTTELRESCLEAIRELSVDPDFQETLDWFYDVGPDFEAYVKDMLARSTRRTETIVPETIFWAESGGEFVGRISIRHDLTPGLARIGGHIGYDVRPSFRKKGIASEMLRLALPHAKSFGIQKALLTCDENNAGSIKVIEKNGGVLEGKLDMGEGHPRKLRYWINL
jgi:predicted acetyltransferase